jgi:hypothetical protein
MEQEKEKLYLQSVIIKKPIELEEARRIAQGIIRNKKKTVVTEKENSYHFRNLPMTKFKLNSYVTKVVNDKISLIFGKLL